jgi:hypothetical protein
MAKQGRVRIDLPAGPIRVGVTASVADTEWLTRRRPVSAAAASQRQEMTDEEADELWPPRTRAEADRRNQIAAAAKAAATDDVYSAIWPGES